MKYCIEENKSIVKQLRSIRNQTNKTCLKCIFIKRTCAGVSKPDATALKGGDLRLLKWSAFFFPSPHFQRRALPTHHTLTQIALCGEGE